MSSQPLRPQHPAGKPRIFLIGFNKCGTTSFHNFFKANGIASVHYRFNSLAMTMHQHRLSGHRPLLDGLEFWTAYTDLICVPGTPWGRSNSDDQPVIEAGTYFRELHRDYPDSLFILNTRDPFAWLQSRLQHQGGRFAHAYRSALAADGIENDQQLSDRWLRDWYAHHHAVLEYFQQHAPEQLLVFHLEHTPVERLVNFLEPHFQLSYTTAFPHDNPTDETQESEHQTAAEIRQQPAARSSLRAAAKDAVKQLTAAVAQRLRPAEASSHPGEDPVQTKQALADSPKLARLMAERESEKGSESHCEDLSWRSNDGVLATLEAHEVVPQHLRHDNVILVPGQPCAYSAETGLPLSETFLTRGPTRHSRRFTFSPQLEIDRPCSREYEHVLYVTFLNQHFGHLLTESLGHCWHAFDPPAELACPATGSKPTLIIQNCKGPAEGPLLEQLSQRYEVLLGQQLSGRSRIQHLHAASPTLIFGYGISPRHLEEVRGYVQRIVGDPLVKQLSDVEGHELVYLSRQNLDSALRHLVQEEVLVEELRNRGWQIVHPQELPLAEQLATYARARVIAGNLASAFHLLMAFGAQSPTLSDKHVLALVGEQIPKIYPMQFVTQGLRCDYLPCLKTVPYPPEQTTNLTLLDQEFTASPAMIAEMIHARAQQI